MKKHLHLLLTLLLLVIGVGSVWAQDETIDMSQQGYTNGTQYTETKGINCTITYAGSENDGRYYNEGKGIRIYGGGSFTVSSTTKKITNLTLTFSSIKNCPNDANVASTGKLKVGKNIQTWKSSDAAGVESVTFKNPYGGTQWRLQKVAVTYYKGEDSDLTTVADALTKDDGTVVYIKAKVARTETYNSSYKYLNYYLSDDGTNGTTIEVFKGLGLNNAEITSADQIARGDEVIISGTTKTYNNTKELVNTTLLSLTEGQDAATITDAGWATYVTKRTVDFSNADVKAFTAKYDATANTITLTPVTTVPGNTAIVLKGNAGTYTLTHAESTDAISNNDLQFYTTDKKITAAKTTYVLAKNGDVCGFYPLAKDETLGAYKGYIYIKDASAAKSVYAIGGTTTNINNALINNAQRGIRYNLNGQRVCDSYKGVVIENGKKLVVK